MNKTSPLFRLLKMETVHSKQTDESADPMHALSRAQIPPSPSPFNACHAG